LQSVGKVFFLLGRAAMPAHLRQLGKAGLEAMALPVLLVDFP
jgi:hypothetical protein